jgi:hypothetical protein
VEMYLAVIIGRAWQGGLHDGDRYFADATMLM